MDNKEELKRRIAWLESRLDQVETELANLNQLLQNCGFPEGIRTLKTTIQELLVEAEDLHFPLDQDDELPPTQTFNPFA